MKTSWHVAVGIFNGVNDGGDTSTAQNYNKDKRWHFDFTTPFADSANPLSGLGFGVAVACLGLSQFQEPSWLLRCLRSVRNQEEFMAGGPNNTMFPINIKGLQELHQRGRHHDGSVHDKPNYYPFYLAGIFGFPEDYDSDDLDMMTKAAIIRGAVVYSDDICDLN